MVSIVAQAYRANAEQCLSWAESASDPENRDAFFTLAATWVSAAARIEHAARIENCGVAARTKFLYFLSSPTTGSELANLATLISRNPQIAKMRLMQSSEYLGDLQRTWLSAKFGFPTYCAYEKKETFGVLVVSQISASSLCTRALDPIDADHIDIAKPLNQKSAQFEAFANAYRENAAITFASSSEMSVQYARLFGALEIPKLMALIPNPPVRNDFAAPEYRTFGRRRNLNVVRTDLVRFAEQLPFKDARPVLTPMWSDIAYNKDAALGIFLRASSGNQKERACFYGEPIIDGFFMAEELLGSLWPGWEACKKSSKHLTGESVLRSCWSKMIDQRQWTISFFIFEKTIPRMEL
jgi:hypothetical protein